MSYPCTWQANSTEPGDHSGVGEFKVDGETYTFALPAFADFDRIGKALDAAFQSGKRFGEDRVADKVRHAIRDLERAR